MAVKVFWTNPYQAELLTTISAVRISVEGGYEVELAETIFYAESGGQESDHGTIAGYPVLRARKEAKSLIYELDTDKSFSVGDPVEIRIDWHRRYSLMRLHFAAELVLELFYRTVAGLEKTGAHISENKSRIDFAHPDSIAPLLDAVQLEAQQMIDADLPIESRFSDEAGELRVWEVSGFACVPCGGTHLRKTSEVGKIQLKRKNIGKGRERVEIYLCDNQQH